MIEEKRKRRTKKDVDYLSNKEFLPQIISCQETNIISNRLGEMFMILATRYASKPNFSGYTYKDEMISHAIVACVASVNKFNTEKSENPFAYYTQVIHTAFLQILNKEKKHQNIRDKALVEADMNPSYNYDGGKSDLYNEDHEVDVDNIGFEMLDSVDSKPKEEEPTNQTNAKHN